MYKRTKAEITLERVFRILARRSVLVWHDIWMAQSTQGFRPSEDTITEMAILDLIERFTPSEIEVYRLNRRKEKVFGSDFDIWFKYSGKWVGYRLQAKLCDPSGKFRVNPKQHATLTGGTAEGIPLYCLYYPYDNRGCWVTCACEVDKGCRATRLCPCEQLNLCPWEWLAGWTAELLGWRPYNYLRLSGWQLYAYDCMSSCTPPVYRGVYRGEPTYLSHLRKRQRSRAHTSGAASHLVGSFGWTHALTVSKWGSDTSSSNAELFTTNERGSEIARLGSVGEGGAGGGEGGGAAFEGGDEGEAETPKYVVIISLGEESE